MFVLFYIFMFFYITLGLLISAYFVSFAFIGGFFEKKFVSICDKFDYVMVVFFTIVITILWPAFVVVFMIIRIFDDEYMQDMNDDFTVVINHTFGQICNIF